MINNIDVVRSYSNNNDMTLNIFWESSEHTVPRIVQMSVASWLAHGHNVNIWTLGKEFDFGLGVDELYQFIDLKSIADDIPMDMMYSQKKPFGKEGRYIAGFVDWCRFKIMSLLPHCIIMDTDVILLKPFITESVTFVCEESFRASNELSNFYPCAGIIRGDYALGNYLLNKANESIHDGMEHGHLMKHIYEYCVKYKPLVFKQKKEEGINLHNGIRENNQFFELYYDELDVFYSPLERKTIRRLKDVNGIHCWMSILDEEKAFADYTILDILWKIIKKHNLIPTYDLLRFRGIELK